MEDRAEEYPQVHTPFFPSNGRARGGKYRSTEDQAAESLGEASRPGKRRFLINGLATLVCSATTANIFSFTYASVLGSPSDLSTVTSHSIDPRIDMILPRSWVMGLLYGAAPVGNVVGILLSLALTGRISVRYQTMACLCLSSLSTLLIPWIFDVDPVWRVPFIALLRFMQGIGSSVIVPIMLNLAANWTAPGEISLVFAITSCQAQIGIMFTSITAYFLCDIGWRSICVVSAMYSTLLLIPWAIFYYDSPSQNCFIGKAEVELLSRDDQPKETISYSSVLRKILSSLTVWAVLVAAFGSYGGISPLYLFQTSILKRGLKLTNQETCVVAFLSALMHLVFKFFSCVYYYKSGGSENCKTKVFSFGACGVTGLLFIIIFSGFFEDKYVLAFLIGLAQALTGFSYSGFHTAAMVVARQYTPQLMSIFLMFSVGTSMVEPAVIAISAPEQSWSQWRVIIGAHGGLLILSNIFYSYAAEVKPAKFTQTVTYGRPSDCELVEMPPPNEMME